VRMKMVFSVKSENKETEEKCVCVCICEAAFRRHKEEEVYLSKLMCIILLLKKNESPFYGCCL